MANMAVAYRGPDLSLIALTNELRSHYGQPARTYEYVTGYKSAGNFSGHNPDSNGIVHAVDIFTDDFGNIPQPEGRALAERLRLVGAATNRFSYLIHDMSAGAPAPKIAGQFNGWVWQAYTEDDHSDHIHVSVADLYWGDPCPVPASVYNNTARWNVTGKSAVKPQASTVTKIQEDTLSQAEVKQINDYTAALLLNGYTLAGVKHPGIGMVVEEEQRRAAKDRGELAGIKSVVEQLAAKQGVAIDYGKVEEAVKKALADGTVQVDVTVAGGK